jgi:ABC-type antimicrobial peptide transport system permease subunit
VKYLPLIQNEYPAGGYFLEGERLATHGVISNNSAPGYFRAMGTEIVAGRDFTATDVNGSMPVAIVDEDFARPLGTRMVGRKVMLDFGRGNTWTYTVVGVVRTIHMNHSIVHGGLRAQIYFPFEQPRGGVGGPGYMTFVARVHGDAAEYLPVLRDAMQQVDGSIPVYDVKTLDQRLGDALARPRFYTTAILFLAGFALLLAIIGIYGVASYSVGQRTKEIGVRLAVGASTGVVRGMLLRESLWPLGVGMTAGVFGAIGLGRFLQSLMDSADPVSTWTCAAAAILLVFAGAVAVWRATARVVRVDPMRALRTD